MAVKTSVAKGYDADYLLRSISPLAKSSAEYYMAGVNSGEPPGVWYGTGAELLGLVPGSEVDKEAYYRLFRDRIAPDGTKFGRAANGSAKAEEVFARLVAAEPQADDSRRRELRIQAQAQARQSPMFFDLTNSVSKSISVYHASIGENYRQAVHRGDAEAAAVWADMLTQMDDMIMRGNQAALDYIQREAGHVRVGTHAARVDGREAGRWEEADLVHASFRQNTSRHGDPQIHVHNATATGAITRSDKKVRAVDSRGFYQHARPASSVMSLHLENAMTRAFGVDWVPRADGQGHEIAGIGDAVMKVFSSRRADVERYTASVLVPKFRAEYGREPSQAELSKLQQKATLATRNGKDEAVIDWELTRAGWAEKAAREAGVDLGAFARDLGHGGDASRDPRDPSPQPDLDAMTLVVSKATAACAREKSSWTRADLLTHVGRMMPRTGADPAAMVRLAEETTDRALAGEFGDVVCLEAPELVAAPESRRRADGRSVYSRPGATRYATRGQLAAERKLLDLAQREGAPVMEREEAARHLGASVAELESALRGDASVDLSAKTGSGLRLDQAAAGFRVLTSGHRVTVISAAAGSGKTTTATTLAGIHQATGRDVVGLAPSSAARNTLRQGIDNSWNLHQFLGHLPELRGALGPKPTGDQVLAVLDEASMAATPDVADALAAIIASDGLMALIGDPQQLQAVESGGAMSMLARRMGSLNLVEPVRFRQDWEGPASARFRTGDTSVISEYVDHGRVRAGALEHVLDQAASAYVARHLQGYDVLLTSQTHEHRQELNRRIAAELRHLGVVHGPSVRIGEDNRAAAGSLVVATRNDNKTDTGGGHLLSNRDVFRVEEVTSDGFMVLRRALEGDRETGQRQWSDYTFRTRDTGRFTSAWAVTAHVAQSRTVKEGLALITGSESRQAAYVQLTRGADTNIAFVATPNPKAADPLPDVRPAPELARYRRVEAARSGEAAEQAAQDMDAAAAVLADMLANDGEELSATEYQDRALSNADHLGLLYPVMQAETAQFYTERYRELVFRELPAGYQGDDLGPTERWLYRTVRAAELAGMDPSEVIRRAVRTRDLDGSRDVAAVLDARIREQTGAAVPQSPLSWSEQVPEVADPQMQDFLTGLAAIMDERTARIGEHAARESLDWAVSSLGPVPGEPVDRLAWERKAATIGAYRELFGVKGDGIGAEPAAGENPDKRAMWHEALRSMGPVDGPDVRGLSEGELWLRRDQLAIETAWAPRYVNRELGHVRMSAAEARDQAVLSEAEADRAASQELSMRHRALANAARAREEAYRLQEEILARQAEDRAAWERATEHQRLMAVAADSELRRRDPGRAIEPLVSAEPGAVTEGERAELDTATVPGWVTELTEASREFREKLAERESLMVPDEDTDYEDVGSAFPRWEGRQADAVLVASEPMMPASDRVLAGREME